MSQTASRKQLSERLEKDSLATIYATALVFLGAGSLWVHLGMGASLLAWPVIGAWMGMHTLPFLALRYQKFHRVWMFLSLLMFETYCFSLKGLGFVMLPLAPLFFMISVPALMSSFSWQPKFYSLFWAVLWISAFLWSSTEMQLEGTQLRAFTLAFSIHAFFIYSFYWIAKKYSERQSQSLEGMGPRETFDLQRIHASRLQTLGELSASLAHEIAGPLTNIHGYVYQLDEELKSSVKDESIVLSALSRIHANIERVMAITRALKTFARKNFAHSEVSQCSMRQVIEDSLLLTQESFKIAHVELISQVPQEDVMVYGDRTELSQVIINFLMNAKDAVVKSPVKKVILAMKIDEAKVAVWVQDSGGGVAPEHYTEIFNPFYTTKGMGSGTGLGLYISKMISERNKAEIGFQNVSESPGMPAGAKFYIKIRKATEIRQENLAS